MGTGVTIRNCRAALAVSGSTSVGGVVGRIGINIPEPENSGAVVYTDNGGHVSANVRRILLDGVTVVADVSATGYYAGGAVGRSSSTGTLNDVVVAGGTTRITLTGSGITRPFGYGGIAGYIINTSLIDCRWQGTLDMTDTSTSGVNIGGITGSYESDTILSRPQPEILNCRASGLIQYKGKSKTNGQMSIGGFFGAIQGLSANSDKRPKVWDCLFDGEIDAEGSGSSYLNVGGFIGLPGGNGTTQCGPDTENCRTASRRFVVSHYGSGALVVGGFSGVAYGGDFTDCAVEGTIEIVSAPNVNAIYFGGFIGYSITNYTDYEVNLVRCSSQANLISASSRTQYLGGIIGYIVGSGTNSKTTIKSCFASGSITVTGTNNTIYAGGLAGYLSTSRASISNSYALGNITADNSGSGAVYAGGLVGYNYGTIDRSFSAGTVYAASSTGSVSARGVCGYGSTTAKVSNCAALGAKVTLTRGSSTPTTVNLGRITGYFSSGTTIDNNYAGNWMLTGSAAYDLYVPGAPVTGGTLTNKDGKDAGQGAFRTPAQWGLLNFSEADGWNFTSLTGKGYPTLVGVEGQ
jgi:hypothetical protein